ncbi:MAG: 2-oxoacid:acceptor oxidoreductase family protein [Deltaproteobacteria bacterium]
MAGITQVCLSGFGGQGIILAGLLLGQAGVIDGRYVSGSSSYGAQARGSECKSEIVFSDQAIDYPHLIEADYLIAMSQKTYDLYSKEVREGSGLILYDQGIVTPKKDLKVKQAGFPATEYSVKKLKNKQMANILLLGAFVEITKLVSLKAMKKAISTHVSERFKEINLKALQLGMEMARHWNG